MNDLRNLILVLFISPYHSIPHQLPCLILNADYILDGKVNFVLSAPSSPLPLFYYESFIPMNPDFPQPHQNIAIVATRSGMEGPQQGPSCPRHHFQILRAEQIRIVHAAAERMGLQTATPGRE